MLKIREALLIAAGTIAGIAAIIVYIQGGHPGFGAVALAVALIVCVPVAIAGEEIARRQGRVEGRLLGARITTWYVALLFTFILVFAVSVSI